LREEKIRVIITPDGSGSVEVIGVKGKRCLKITEELEGDLGNVTERKTKAEILEKETTISANRNQSLYRR